MFQSLFPKVRYYRMPFTLGAQFPGPCHLRQELERHQNELSDSRNSGLPSFCRSGGLAMGSLARSE